MKKQMEKNGTDIYEMVTAMIIEKLEAGIIPWKKSWSADKMPANYLTKKPYRGINLWLLLSMGFQDPYFMTFNQVKEMNGYLEKGAKSIPVVFWNFIYVHRDTGKKISDAQKLNYQPNELKKISYLKYYRVFHISDVKGIEFVLPQDAGRIIEDVPEACNKVISDMCDAPKIIHRDIEAYYLPDRDLINMPGPDKFISQRHYYAVLFHELVHATGHEKRLNREAITERHAFGSNTYSKEELTAEMGAGYLSCHTGILNEDLLENTAAYIEAWLKKLRNDKTLVIEAASRAQKAVDYILNTCPF